jgi:dTDP-4-amino-4,6-dideoxygalactose transaminase
VKAGPAGEAPIPFIDLVAQRRRLGRRIDAAVARVAKHGRLILGPEVEAFERALAAFCGARHAVACASGTDALVLILRALGVGRGQAVMVPAFTFAGTAEAVALVGAVPVFVDVGPRTSAWTGPRSRRGSRRRGGGGSSRSG